MIRIACIALALSVSPAIGAVVEGPPPYTGPDVAKFFIITGWVDSIPVLKTEWRCLVGDIWWPLTSRPCLRHIFGNKLPEPIPKHQDRLE